MAEDLEPGRPALEAVFVALVATGSVGVGVVHALARVLPPASTQGSAAAAVPLTLTVLFVCVSFAVAQAILSGSRSVGYFGLAIPIAGAVLLAVRGADPSAVVAVMFAGVFLTPAAYYLAIRLTGPLAGAFRRRRGVVVIWALLGTLLLVQSARLSTFMADPSFDWWLTTRNELWAKHMCMAAYVEAADLHRQGAQNVYDAAHYATLNRAAKPTLTVTNLETFAGDAFQYPPPFLLLPQLALKVTNDYLAIRTVWYGLQVMAFVLVSLALCSWLGGAGWTAAFLFPVVWLSIPAMQSLQYGQFHLAAVLLALGAMLAFAKHRDILGGSLLAAAVLAKIFPGVLLVWLLAQRRWRQAAWTAAWAAAFTLLALAVLGPHPFTAFLQYQLPRLASGAAFDFTRDWPELRNVFVADNLSPAGLVAKLATLGVPGMTPRAGHVALTVYGLLVLVLAATAWRPVGSRVQQVWLWLALLNLAAFAGYGAWGDYITLGSVWLLSFMAGTNRRSAVLAGLVGVCWVLCALVPGVQPVPEFLPVRNAMLLSGLTAVGAITLNVWVLLGPSRAKILPS